VGPLTSYPALFVRRLTGTDAFGESTPVVRAGGTGLSVSCCGSGTPVLSRGCIAIAIFTGHLSLSCTLIGRSVCVAGNTGLVGCCRAVHLDGPRMFGGGVRSRCLAVLVLGGDGCASHSCGLQSAIHSCQLYWPWLLLRLVASCSLDCCLGCRL
jgi:hypothetical protein